MPDSILNTTKKALGISLEDKAFDPDIIMHINSVFFTLNQLGGGPADGFEITDETMLWETYTGHKKNLNAIKTYMYLRVRLLFDPPATSFAIEAMQKQVEQFEWRLNIELDKIEYPQEFFWVIQDYEGFPEEAQPGDLGFDPATGNIWRKL